MITLSVAVKAKPGTVFLHATLKNSDGISRLRCRTIGVCKTWKKKPGEFDLPIVNAAGNHYSITNDNAADWLTQAEIDTYRSVVCPRGVRNVTYSNHL
jgi:hypothetical protein